MVKLKILGIEDSTIEKYHYEFLKKDNVKINWMKFADRVSHPRMRIIFNDQSKYVYPRANYDVQESRTDETVVVNVTLRFRFHDYSGETVTYHTLKSYHGKSTRPLKRTRRPKNENEEMTNEA